MSRPKYKVSFLDLVLFELSGRAGRTEVASPPVPRPDRAAAAAWMVDVHLVGLGCCCRLPNDFSWTLLLSLLSWFVEPDT